LAAVEMARPPAARMAPTEPIRGLVHQISNPIRRSGGKIQLFMKEPKNGYLGQFEGKNANRLLKSFSVALK
jgi:hypothetical protein